MEEHHVFFSLTSPPLLRGIPVGFAMYGFITLGIIWIYGGLFFDIFWVRIATPGAGVILYFVAVRLTKHDIFWFSKLMENLSFFKSLEFLKKETKYRA